MKRWSIAFICLLAVALLTACAGTTQPGNGLLEFPKTSWEMTPEEVMVAYGVSKDTVTVNDSAEQPAFSIENLACFGQTASNVIFSFQKDDAGVLRLANVLLLYPDEADMGQVKSKLTDDYGSSIPQFTNLRTAPGGTGYEEETLEETEHFAFWHSITPVSQYLNTEQLATFSKAAEKKDNEMQAGGVWKAYAQQMPLVTLTWENNARLPGATSAPVDYPKNRVEFNASILHYLPQLMQGA